MFNVQIKTNPNFRKQFPPMRLLLPLLLFGFFASAQPSRIEMNSARFATGDDPAYSKPDFNDAGWKTLAVPGNWEPQGFEGYNGFAWYRFHVTMPAAMRDKAWWKDSVILFLAKIDDADEVYVNGTRVSKTGSFPSDPQGYYTRYNADRKLSLPSAAPYWKWDQENIIAVRVYDGGGPGGIYGAVPSLRMPGLADVLEIEMLTVNASNFVLSNRGNKTLEGNAQIITRNGKDSSVSDNDITLEPGGEYLIAYFVKENERTEVEMRFTDTRSGESIRFQGVPPYILTPEPKETPRINSASVFGVRPGSPFLFKVAATGIKPLRFSASGLPAGLKLDPETGIITGTLGKKGNYPVQLTVSNSRGNARQAFTIKCGDGLALTPPLGWNSWNCWGLSVSDEKVKASAQALLDKGLADHGWTYINIDDGWEAPERAASGEIVTNKKFPDMKALGDWLHARGLKFGIYSSPGPRTCGGYLGSWQHETQDATTYNNWGIDYLKYDWCSYETIHGGKDTSLSSYQLPYRVMQKALRSQPRDIVYSLCQYGMKDVWQWGAEVDGNCWRTTGDIEDSWESLYRIGFAQYRMSPYAKPGRWNDPDMLIVGKVGWGEHLHDTRLTPDEQYTHISLWCLLSSPLLIGCDISQLDNFTLSLLTNDEVLAINQDPLGRQAFRAVINDKGAEVWVKELSDGSKAVGLFNTGEETATVSFDAEELQWKTSFTARDCWRQKDLGKFTTYSASVPAHGVVLLRVRSPR